MTLKQMLGLDTRAERYTYGTDPVAGYVSAQKVPDKWVSTTCGYCSVGCGMFIGVKDGRAVAVDPKLGAGAFEELGVGLSAVPLRVSAVAVRLAAMAIRAIHLCCSRFRISGLRFGLGSRRGRSLTR